MELQQTATNILKALLFSSAEPLFLDKIQEIMKTFHPFSLEEIKELLNSLKEHYSSEDEVLQIDEVSNGFLLRTKLIYRPYIEKLKGVKRPEKLSLASIEVLAIVSHKQPITRSSIEAIRGVDSSNIIHSLVEKELLVSLGKEETLGRPTLYGVTSKFLQYFGLKNLTELPLKTS
jgi:segregation and condensation protein B